MERTIAEIVNGAKTKEYATLAQVVAKSGYDLLNTNTAPEEEEIWMQNNCARQYAHARWSYQNWIHNEK